MSDKLSFEKESLEYHKAKGEFDTNGKTATLLTKPCTTQEELSMAYSPGVAYPCLEIQKDLDLAMSIQIKGI